MNSNLVESNQTQSKNQSNEDQAKLNYSICDLFCFSICCKSWMKKCRSQKFKKFTEKFNRFTLEDDKFLNEIDIINVLNSIRDLKIIVNDLAKQRLDFQTESFINKNAKSNFDEEKMTLNKIDLNNISASKMTNIKDINNAKSRFSIKSVKKKSKLIQSNNSFDQFDKSQAELIKNVDNKNEVNSINQLLSRDLISLMEVDNEEEKDQNIHKSRRQIDQFEEELMEIELNMER